MGASPGIATSIGTGAGGDADGVGGVVAAEGEENDEGGAAAVHEDEEGDERLHGSLGVGEGWEDEDGWGGWRGGRDGMGVGQREDGRR